jgi:hypothetical protein
MPHRTFNDSLSFVTPLLQLKAFSHIMFGMTTKSMIYKVKDLIISFNVYGHYELVTTKRLVELLSMLKIARHVFFCLSSSFLLLIILLVLFHTLVVEDEPTKLSLVPRIVQ